MRVRAFVCLWSYFVSSLVGAQKESVVKGLRDTLMRNYDKTERPITNDNETTVVQLAYVPKHIFELDEETETLTVEGYIQMTWTDEKLVWNPQTYENVTSLRFDAKTIWKPDIFFLFSPGQNNVDQGRDSVAYVTSQGRVTFYPPTSYQAPCVTNYRHYPMDKHTCVFEFGSWTHSGDSIFLNVYDKFTLDKNSVIGAEWKMVDYSYAAVVMFQSESEKYPYHAINFTMTIERTSNLAEWVTAAPVLASALLATGGFWLELRSIPRYAVGLANYVMMSVHLLSLARTLPAGRDVPLLAEFSAATLVMAVVFLAESVILHSTDRRRDGPPAALLRLARNVPDKLLPGHQTESATKPEEEEPQQEPDVTAAECIKDKSEWKFVCLVFDGLFFYLFSLVYVIVIACIFSI